MTDQASTPVPQPHPNLEPLLALAGTWRGKGWGEYPTIKPFEYDDEFTFEPLAGPFFRIRQSTWIDGKPRHQEVGFLRVIGGPKVEVVMSLATGQAENGSGQYAIEGDTLRVTTEAGVVNTPSAINVKSIVREFLVRGDELEYTLAMAAVGQEMDVHLSGRLTRVK